MVTLSVGDSVALTAAVTGAAEQTVAWSLREGDAAGSVTENGVYTAPAAPGTYHVVATSVADPTRSAEVTVVVQAGDATGVIQ